MDCRICAFTGTPSAVREVRRTPIRAGSFGRLTDTPVPVLQCDGCGSQFLGRPPPDLKAFYESTAYRESVDGGASVETYRSLHDAEAQRHLAPLADYDFGNRVVADIGCGGGSFLDRIRGETRACLAVEPAAHYHRSLKERGYAVFPYAEAALAEYEEQVDLAVSFSVLEHVEDPCGFLSTLRRLLRPGGELLLATPNRRDVLMSLLPESYPPFFYRVAHLWYFDADSLTRAVQAAGFGEPRPIPRQRFGMSNLIQWARDRKPPGDRPLDFVSPGLDALWRAELERTFRCDYLYLRATRPK